MFTRAIAVTALTCAGVSMSAMEIPGSGLPTISFGSVFKSLWS